MEMGRREFLATGAGTLGLGMAGTVGIRLPEIQEPRIHGIHGHAWPRIHGPVPIWAQFLGYPFPLKAYLEAHPWPDIFVIRILGNGGLPGRSASVPLRAFREAFQGTESGRLPLVFRIHDEGMTVKDSDSAYRLVKSPGRLEFALASGEYPPDTGAWMDSYHFGCVLGLAFPEQRVRMDDGRLGTMKNPRGCYCGKNGEACWDIALDEGGGVQAHGGTWRPFPDGGR